jgi:hypothetical protein
MIGLLLILMQPAAAEPLLTLDFAVSNGGMTAENGLQWSWGELSTGPASEGPIGPAWATRPDGNYLNDASESLQLPAADISNASRVVMAIDHWYEMDQTGDGDFGWVEVFSDGAWSRVPPAYGYPAASGFTGSSEGWRTDWFVLAPLLDASDIRLVFASDAAVSRSGWYISAISIEDGDPIPPVISDVVEPVDTQDVAGPYPVTATVVDDLTISRVTLLWSVNGGSTKTARMDDLGDGTFTGEIPGADPAAHIAWWIRASDGKNRARWPVDDDAEFRVFLAPPTGLRAPDLRPDGGFAGERIELRWTEPQSPHAVDSYFVYRGVREIASSDIATAMVPVEDGPQTLSVRALYATVVGDFLGDASSALGMTAVVPIVDGLRPSNAWQGDTVRITVEGENLFMSADLTHLDLGEDVHTQRVDIVDVNHAVFTIFIADDAVVGTREATLVNGETVLPTGVDFEVADGADRPRLLSVTPARIQQGQRTTLTIQTNVPVAPDPVVDLGAGLFVEDVRVEDDLVHVGVASASNAPLGDHLIIVDDGTRILDGASVDLRDATSPPKRVCSSMGPTSATLGAWLGILFGLTLRRRRS